MNTRAVRLPRSPAASVDAQRRPGAHTVASAPLPRVEALQAMANRSAPVQRVAALQRAATKTVTLSSTRGVLQRAQGDYAALWQRDPSLAKLAIKQSSFGNYLQDAKDFEHALGAGLFNAPLAHQGADALINAIEALLGSAGAANAAFGSSPNSKEAGAIPSNKVAEARTQGNLREKMYMIYAAIRSGDIAKKMAENEYRAVPKKKNDTGAVVEDKRTLIGRHLARRDSIREQQRPSNPNRNRQDRMTRDELNAKGAGLSPRETALAASQHPKFYPGGAYFSLDPGLVVSDSSAPTGRTPKSHAQYQSERLAPLVAGLSGTTDWYFNLASQLGLSDADKRKLRLAALGQMLVNRDHSYHEVMHEARTRGKLDDYPDELPMGYTTLAPLSPGQIINATGKTQFPGDKEAEAYDNADRTGQQPKGAALLHGLPTASGFIHLAGKATHHWMIFGGGMKGTHYPGVLRALDRYSQAVTPAARTIQLQAIKTHADAWLQRHAASVTGAKAKRLEPLRWLSVKAVAMLKGKNGPDKPTWIDATYNDPAGPDPAAERDLYSVIQDDSATYDASKELRQATRLVDQLLDPLRAADPKSKLGMGPARGALQDTDDLDLVRRAFVDAHGGGESLKAAKEFLALNKYTKEGFEFYNPILKHANDDDKASRSLAKKLMAKNPFGPKYQKGSQETQTMVDNVRKRELPKARKEAELAVRALYRLSPYRGGMLWRGGGLGGGNIITSFAKDFHSSFAAKTGYNTAVCLETYHSGRDISFISSNYIELEVVFPPGTQFQEVVAYDAGKWPKKYADIAGDIAKTKRLKIAKEV
ncbi:MAG: hypothetical protein AAFX85_00745 [Pseudomonadota bacterium]